MNLTKTQLIARVHAWFSTLDPYQPTFFQDVDPDAFLAIRLLTTREQNEIYTAAIQFTEFAESGTTLPVQPGRRDYIGACAHG